MNILSVKPIPCKFKPHSRINVMKKDFKIYHRYLLLCIMGMVFMLSSCKKWLDVAPATELKESEQFSSQSGFIDALFGIYQKAADESLYGGQLSYGLIDILAQRYENKATVAEYYGQIARYNYAASTATYQASAVIERIWANSYAAIAQCNYILANVDKRRDVLSPEAYSIIKGEALGMRAFLHFDLMRMFGPAYLNGANADRIAIPYMNAFQVKPQERLTMSVVFDRCEADLKAAEALLSVYPVIDQIANNQNNTSTNLFLEFRQNHFNYWAAKAALARLYLYKGDKAQALKYAKEVIGTTNFSLVSTVPSNDTEGVSSDLTFTREHIFSVYVKGLKVATDQLFKSNGGTLGEEMDLFSTEAKLNVIYESTGVGYSADIRSLSAMFPLWNKDNAASVFTKKYHVGANVVSVRQSRIPVIRLSEMYYIAAESESDPALGLDHLNKMRIARLLPAINPNSPEEFQNEIFKEYRKDFFAEGQLWFYYKRKNTIQIPNSPDAAPMTEAKYVFPLPIAEIEFGK